jgi:multiple sugar transport system ATP-binding protein
MAEVVLESVTKIYPGDVRAVDDIDLSINDREFIVLVGPSGCGKSTTLRMIAGLEDLTAGTIRIGERVVNDVAPKDRNIAMVFQNYALYPHMTVYKNMAFGLMLRREHGAWDNPLGMVFGGAKYKQARAERREIDRRVRSAATMLGIEDLLHRRPKALSGGQRQRVAVGRAIVREPQAFLFDEPLSNLDAKLRIEMRAELKRLHRRVQTTTIYVTHDQEEAMTLGDRVVVMKDGVIHQCGTPFDVYERPVNRFVAGFVGTPPMNFFEGRIARDGNQLVFDEGDNRLTLCPAHQQRLSAFADRPLIMGVRPETLSLATDAAPGTTMSIHVDVVEPLGERMDVVASTKRHDHIVCRIDARTPINEATTVDMRVDMERVHFFEPDAAGRNVSLVTD